MTNYEIDHDKRMEFPSLSRDVTGLWLPLGAELIDPIRRDLFKKPRFGIVLPGLGRHAVRQFGLHSAIDKVSTIADSLPPKHQFSVSNTFINRSNGMYIVGLQTTTELAATLTQEREIARNALESDRTSHFKSMAVASMKDYEDAASIGTAIDRYLSYIDGADMLELGPPTLAIRS